MGSKVICVFVTLLSGSLFVAGPLRAATPTSGEIKANLMCLCDCSMTVDACEGAMACESAAGLATEINSEIEEGRTKDEILQVFVSKYGETILAAPTKSGFNLTAWILPFAALLAAGVGVVALLFGWVAASPARSTPNSPVENDATYDRALNRYLEILD